MLKGIIFALGACLIWGLIFVVPQFMEGFSPLEVTFGRYLVYGFISSLILMRGRMRGVFRYPPSIWLKAFYFSLMGSIGYYPFIVLALRYSTPAICALIVGLGPITSAIYGNWKEKEGNLKHLILPSIFIIVGLVVINLPHFQSGGGSSQHLWGLLAAFWALTSWSWYVVANSAFLKKNPDVPPGDWSTMIGVSVLFWIFLLIIGYLFFFPENQMIEKLSTPGPVLTKFILGSAVLGLLCSWVGAFLWNRASLYLPISLAAQLTIFETIFGILFVYILQREMPPPREILGISLLLGSIVYGILVLSRSERSFISIDER